ncbi:MAG: MopE-related protein, partial [Myxococcota bacterium]
LCDGLDNDCDDEVDEGNPEAGGDCETDEPGVCRQGTVTCDEGGLVCQRNNDPAPFEQCNGVDDDCDGFTDEGNPDGGATCDTDGLGICRQGTVTCEDGGLICQPNTEPQEEVCDGLDNNCDGEIDEGRVCGPYVQTQCRVFAAWADNNEGPNEPTPTWLNCPEQDEDFDNNLRCVGTRRDGNFVKLLFDGGRVDSTDKMAVGLFCDDDTNPDLASYIQSHCALFFGQADINVGDGLNGGERWGACPQELRGTGDGGQAVCTSTGFDGQFRAVNLIGLLGNDDSFAVAWKCFDNDDPNRAAALQTAASVFLGWADVNQGPSDGSPTWGPCPAMDEGITNVNGLVRHCTSTQGDGNFHILRPTGEVNFDDQLGWALRAR